MSLLNCFLTVWNSIHMAAVALSLAIRQELSREAGEETKFSQTC
jgi:hypothetical protein